MNVADLEPVEYSDDEDSYSGYIKEKFEKRKFEIDYEHLICIDCKKKKAELIRGTNEYLCVDCFKKWIASRKKKEEVKSKDKQETL